MRQSLSLCLTGDLRGFFCRRRLPGGKSLQGGCLAQLPEDLGGAPKTLFGEAFKPAPKDHAAKLAGRLFFKFASFRLKGLTIGLELFQRGYRTRVSGHWVIPFAPSQ